MYAEYKRDVCHNYLILHSEESIDTSSYQVRMLTGNTIPSILKCSLQNLDGKTMFYYDITSKQSVASFYDQRKFKEKDLTVIYQSFIRVMEDMAEYLLNVEQLVLCPEYMFLDVEKNEISFCCLPNYGHSIQEQFRELTEYFLPKLDHEDQAAVNLGYGIYRKAMEPGLQLEHIKENVYKLRSIPCENETPGETSSAADIKIEISEEKNSVSEKMYEEKITPKEDSVSKENPWGWEAFCVIAAVLLFGITGASYIGYLPEIPVEIVLGAAIGLLGVSAVCTWLERQKEKKKEQTAEWRRKVQEDDEKNVNEPVMEQSIQRNEKIESCVISQNEASIYAGKQIQDTAVEKEQYGETIVLSAGELSGPASLVSLEPGELPPIYLEKELTVIGKLENASDAVIALPTVSRIHARIRKIDEAYYLADLNSKNGTSVNGRLLKPGEEYLLQDEDQVDFAQARYVFIDNGN